ncbi:hypothetical protein [Larkinella soli]|uniref:hypothetical protein n=1 Tax=Larkinella soli TaxID=1770527 RepID=UPI000FFB40E6|nr:hypothetical protein [Larkinella soli]
MKPDKISFALAEQLRQAPDEAEVDVVVELAPAPVSSSGLPAGSRQEKMAFLQQAFREKKEPIEQLIREQGGQVLDSVWLNQTLRARIPARCLDQLTERDEIMLLDASHPLTTD